MAKIDVNGEIRDMTPEEETEFLNASTGEGER